MGRVWRQSAVSAAVVILCSGCAARSVPVLVTQSALATAQSVGHVQLAAEQLHRAGSLTTPQAITVQTQLLKVNRILEGLVPTLRAIDRLQQEGVSLKLSEIDPVLQALVEVSQELGLVVAGVPVAESARSLLDAVRVAQQAVATTLVEVARLRATLEKSDE